MKFVLFTDTLADLSVARACESAKAAGSDVGYKGETSFRRMSAPDLLAQSAADLRYLNSLIR